jgi:hypothetical protein
MPQKAWRRALTGFLLPAAVYTAATAYFTWPLSSIATDHILSDWNPADAIHMIWILSWDVHALVTDPASLFQGNVLHPAPNVLLNSDHMLGVLPIFAPVAALTGNVVLAFNSVVLSSFVLCGLFMHILVRSWTGSNAAGYVAGLTFAFAPWRGGAFHWPHLLNVQYIPLFLLLLDSARKTGRIKVGLLAGAVFLLQLMASYSLAYIVVLILLCCMCADIIVRGIRRPLNSVLAVGAGTILPLAVFCVLSIPYLGATAAYSTEALQMNSEIVRICSQPAMKIVPVYVGLPELVLALAAMITFAKVRVDDDVSRVLGITFILVVALAVATGQEGFFAGAVAPYDWLVSVVPGFSLFRCPLRFGIGFAFATSVLAGFGAVHLLSLSPNRHRDPIAIGAVAIVAAIVLVRIQSPQANPIPTGSSVAPVYHWLAEQEAEGALLELPFDRRTPPSDDRDLKSDALTMYFSTFHWLPLINGYTSYLPEAARVLRSYAEQLPEKEPLQVLIDCADLRWILLHQPGPDELQRWDRLRGSFVREAFASPENGDIVFEVTAPPGPECRVDLGGE